MGLLKDSTSDLKEKIIRLFTLEGNDALLWCDYSGNYGDDITDNQKKHAVNEALNALNQLDLNLGKIYVNNENIDKILLIREAILLVNHHSTNSWNRSRSMLLTNQFLGYCCWSDVNMGFIDCDDYYSTLSTLSKEQLKYYLWWREEAKKESYNVISSRMLWVYIYDLLTNTCFSTPNETLNHLIKLYNKYSDLVPIEHARELTKDKLNSIIASYIIYNQLWDFTNLLNEFKFEDNYNISLSIMNGKFDNLGEYLFSLTTAQVKPKSAIDKESLGVVIGALPKILNELYPICLEQGINLPTHLVGSLDNHELWDPYKLNYLTEETVKLATKTEQCSFTYGDNLYFFIEHEDRVAEPRMQREVFSWYHCDSGKLAEKKGSYYRKAYSGVMPEGKMFMDYIVRTVQNIVRNEHGIKDLKTLPCPYSKLCEKIQFIVREIVTTCTSSEKMDIASNHMFDFMPISEYISEESSQFKYPHMLSQDYHSKKILNNQRDEFMNSIKSYYQQLFSVLENKTALPVKHCEEITDIIFNRDLKGEKIVGIDDLKLYVCKAYNELLIFGEICADFISQDFTFSFTAFDGDDDIISEENNSNYSGKQIGYFCFSTNAIKSSCFYNRYPFSTSLETPGNVRIKRIRITIDLEDE